MAGTLLLLLSLFGLVGSVPALAAAGQVTEFPVSQGAPGTPPGVQGNAMVPGSDGNIWFSTAGPVTIARITPTGQVTQFADPNANASYAAQLTRGSDGNVWFLDVQGLSTAIEAVGRITPAGQISEFPIPAFNGNPVSVNRMALGSDGSIWFTAAARNGRLLANGVIGRVSTTGQISEFGTPAGIIDPTDMALGSDGSIWFDGFSARAIGRVTTAGRVTEFPVPQGATDGEGTVAGNAMVLGSDGNIWFSTTGPATIGRVTPGGQVTQFADPNPNATFAAHFTLGSDGNVWFVDVQGLSNPVDNVGRITSAGQLSEFTLPNFQGNPVTVNQMALGSDGSVWFTANTRNGRLLSNGVIGRVTTAGQIAEFGTPTAVSDPMDMASGSDGNIWFNEDSAHAVGRITTH